MRRKLFAFLVAAGALVTAAHAVATPFLAVDVNGYNAGGGQVQGPTQPGFQDWEAAEGLFLPAGIDWGNSGATGLTKVFPTSQGNVTATMIGVTPSSARLARNRGQIVGAQPALYQDFVAAQKGLASYGQHFIKLTLSGLTRGQTYEVTGYARDPVNVEAGEANPAASFQAWTDLTALGGLDGPGAWMNANFDPDPAVYQSANGGVNNPIPKLARSPASGPTSADLFAYSATFFSTAGAGGVVTLYTWADPNANPSGSSGFVTATLLNGFTVSVASGDYNDNGIVDAADYVDWRKSNGTQTGYDLWRAHFGETVGSGAGANVNTTVPEPAMLVMLLTLAAADMSTRRR